MKISNLTDLPITNEDIDNLGMAYYKEGLKLFIANSQTPLTIAIQGEWGSGKTSLLNSLYYELCDDSGDATSDYHGIWINTWEYGLMMDASSTLINILTAIIDEVIAEVEKIDRTSVEALKEKAKLFVTRFGKAAAKTSANVTLGNDAADIVETFFEAGGRKVTVRQLREELQSTINTFVEKRSKKGFIFFIDDLDRINPPIAVQILELLKNIFDLHNCIFLLAIDYEIVVKGLEPKFGIRSIENEREFRSFFEKIIQLPFSMPVNNYEVKDFIINKLEDLKLMSSDTLQCNSNIIEEISLLTVGKNPRAIKRLMNSLSLLNCISHKDEVRTEEADIARFFLLSLQISYPQIYSVLSKYPDFKVWDNEVIIDYQLTKIMQEDEHFLNNNFFGEEDSEWKKILFLICQKDYYLKSNFTNLIRLFESIETYINSKFLDIETLITSGLKISSVTSVDSNLIHVSKKINLDDYGLDIRDISPNFCEFNRTKLKIDFTTDKIEAIKHRYNLDKWVFLACVFKGNKDSAVRMYIMVGAFENPQIRRSFMQHLGQYSFKITSKMKSIDTLKSTIYSDKLNLKNGMDDKEIEYSFVTILEKSIDTIELFEKAVLDFNWDENFR